MKINDDVYIAHVSKDGKRMQYVEQHIDQTGKYACQIGHKLGLPKLCYLAGILHDFGKYSKEFQGYIKSAAGLINYDEDDWVDAGVLKGKIDHSTAGSKYIHSKFSEDASAIELMARDIIGICIASHHAGLLNICEGYGNYASRVAKIIPDYIENIPDSIRSEVDSLVPDIVKEVSEVFDRKLRTEGRYDPFKAQMLVRMVYSALIDADRSDTADVEDPLRFKVRSVATRYSIEELARKVESYLAKFHEPKTPVDEIRNEVSLECFEASKRPPGFFTLTVPTGGGKTLASLRFALNHAARQGLQRIFYVIPFTSIIDQNAETAREALEDKSEEGKYTTQNVLEQHSNISEGKESSYRKLFAENWDAPVVFTTSVSFLESLFSAGTRNYRRTHSLVKSVIILDEVQTLP